jgi:thymidylate kinase
MRKIVFVEGVSGVGKSTTVVKLCDALIDHGFRAAFHLEGDADNPVDLVNCAYLTRLIYFLAMT